MKEMNKQGGLSRVEILVSACSAVAFFLLATSADKYSLMFNAPFVLLLFLAGMRCGRKDIWVESLLGKKSKLLLTVYVLLTCWNFYQTWIYSGKVAYIADLLHIPVRILLAATAVGLMTVSLPFAVQTLSVFRSFTKGEKQTCQQLPQDRSGGKKIWLACFLVATGIITVCSKSSFLYPMNDWVDANCFFTVGKSMMNGIVPYRDLFEQKGPFLYFLHGIAWWISDDSFLGVYFLEVIVATFFLYYVHQSVSLFVSERTAFLVIPVAALVIYTSPAFCHGDSVEELCLPLLAHAIWVGFRAMMTDSDISDREYFVIGICSGLVFWSKFILVGFYIGWFVVPAWLLLKKKAYKKLFQAIGMVATGVAISTIPFVIYFGMHNAIGDWLEVYLYDNLFLYSKLEGESSGFLKNMQMGRSELFYHNHITYVFCVFGLLWFYPKKKNRPWKNLLSTPFLTYLLVWADAHFYLFGLLCLNRKELSKTAWYMTSMLFFTFLFTYIGGQFHAYYAFVFSVFAPFGIMAAIELLTSAIPAMEKLHKYKGMSVFSVVLCIAAALWLTPNRYLMGVEKKEMPQYQFARIIHQVESPTLLNYGFLDGGFYTAADLLPNCKAFCKLNVPLEEMMQLQEEYVQEGLCDFIVTRGEKLKFDHYTLVAESRYFLEESIQTYYLYQLKRVSFPVA